MLVLSGSISWAFAGNNPVPDLMADMGPDQTHRQQWFPPDFNFRMPAAGTPGKNHIDLHIVCKWWRPKWFARWFKVRMRYTIYYQMHEPSPQAADSSSGIALNQERH
jgi:hypothetical protein